MRDDRERLILLNAVPGIGSAQLARALKAFGTLAAVWRASERQLEAAGLTAAMASRMAAFRRQDTLVERELELAAQRGCDIVTQLDADFPEPLRQIPDPPLAFYRKGAWIEADRIAVAIVGSRHASLYGRHMAERLASELAVRGVTVVSGLARGIDAAAHTGALRPGGRTLAVLGNGLASIYPPEHAELADRIAESGCLLSEYPMLMEPLSINFPRRNRLISGLSLGVVVVEAAEKSGALITADCALEQGREVFAVPGQADAITSQGAHRLLKQGARLVTSVEDIVDELRLEPQAPRPPADSDTARLSDEETRLLASLDAQEPRDLDDLVTRTGWTVTRCAVALSQLELKRAVMQLPGKRFVRHG